MSEPARAVWRPWAAVLLALWALALALLLSRHEMWRDEMQMWLLARDSGSLAELWSNSRYDGHPLLWHLLVYPLAHLLTSPAALQALHWVLAVAGAGIVLARAPFALWVRAGIVFSYLPLYEYGAISRNYALTTLGVWAACAALAAARTPWPAVAGALVAANASPMGIVLAPALAAAVALTPRWRRWRSWALAALAAGVLLAAYQCLPPADTERAGQWNLAWNTRLAAWLARGFVAALLPIPRAVTEFWGSSAFFPSWPFTLKTGQAILTLAGPLVIAVVALVARRVRGSRRALAAWLLAFAGLALMFYVKLPGTTRHFGFFWVALVAVLWMAAADGAASRRWCGWALAPTLAAGVAGAAIAGVNELRSPFSGARAAAAAIAAERLDALPIVGGVDFATSAVAGFLPGGRVYYPARGAEGSFMIYDQARKRRQDRLTQKEIVAEALARDRGEGVVLLLNAPLDARGGSPCRLFHQSRPTIVPDETLYCYLCRPRPAGR